MLLQISKVVPGAQIVSISAETTVGKVIAERLGRARVFEGLGIVDYGCHGGTSLADACAQRSLDVEQVLSTLATIDNQRTDFEDGLKTDLHQYIH